MNNKIWKAHTRRIIEGNSPSIATEIKKDGKRLIKRKPQKRGFIASPRIEDAYSVYMGNLIRDLEGRRGGEDKVQKAGIEGEIDGIINTLIARTRTLAESYANMEDSDISPLVLRERKLLDLGLMFVKCASQGDVPFGKAYIDAGLPVNFQHPVTGFTALHAACAHIVRPPDFVNMLLETDDCDCLIKDRQGRIPYELIFRFGYDLDLVARVEQKTREQAQLKDIKLEFDFNHSPEATED